MNLQHKLCWTAQQRSRASTRITTPNSRNTALNPPMLSSSTTQEEERTEQHPPKGGGRGSTVVVSHLFLGGAAFFPLSICVVLPWVMLLSHPSLVWCCFLSFFLCGPSFWWCGCSFCCCLSSLPLGGAVFSLSLCGTLSFIFSVTIMIIIIKNHHRKRRVERAASPRRRDEKAAPAKSEEQHHTKPISQRHFPTPDPEPLPHDPELSLF